MRRSWTFDVVKVALLLSGCSALGLAVNAVSPRGIALLDPGGPGAPPRKAPRITPQRFLSETVSEVPPLVLDVREPEVFREGHPRGALSAPASQFMEAYRALGLFHLLKAASLVVVLCESDECPAADRAAAILTDLGHPSVFVFDGGWRTYEHAGLPRDDR